MVKKNCPYLGLIDEKKSSKTFPFEGNACYRIKKPVKLTLDYQKTRCLNETYVNCPGYINGWEEGFPKQLRLSNHTFQDKVLQKIQNWRETVQFDRLKKKENQFVQEGENVDQDTQPVILAEQTAQEITNKKHISLNWHVLSNKLHAWKESIQEKREQIKSQQNVQAVKEIQKVKQIQDQDKNLSPVQDHQIISVSKEGQNNENEKKKEQKISKNWIKSLQNKIAVIKTRREKQTEVKARSNRRDLKKVLQDYTPLNQEQAIKTDIPQIAKNKTPYEPVYQKVDHKKPSPQENVAFTQKKSAEIKSAGVFEDEFDWRDLQLKNHKPRKKITGKLVLRLGLTIILVFVLALIIPRFTSLTQAFWSGLDDWLTPLRVTTVPTTLENEMNKPAQNNGTLSPLITTNTPGLIITLTPSLPSDGTPGVLPFIFLNQTETPEP